MSVCGSYTSLLSSAANGREKAELLWLEGKMGLRGLPAALTSSTQSGASLQDSSAQNTQLESCANSQLHLPSLFPQPQKHLCSSGPNKVT